MSTLKNRPLPFAGKVAFITGAARGQGRSHAVRLASEGAAIIAVDIDRDIATIPYPMARREDLDQTVAEVEAVGGKILSRVADVRDRRALQSAVDDGIAQFGSIDIVLANAGVAPVGADLADDEETWRDVIDINLSGAWRTVKVCALQMIEQDRGGAIVLTSSAAGFKPLGTGFAGMEGYVSSKHAVVGLMRNLAMWLAPHRIRVNSVHPSGVDTDMVNNPAMQAMLAGASDSLLSAMSNLIPGGPMRPSEVSNAVRWLVSDEAQLITGVSLPVDGGYAIK